MVQLVSLLWLGVARRRDAGVPDIGRHMMAITAAAIVVLVVLAVLVATGYQEQKGPRTRLVVAAIVAS